MSAVAQSARQKGPIVWLDMDQQALDDAYDQAVYAPNSLQIAKRRTANSAEVRARLKPQRLAYGSTPHEMLDLYVTAKPDAPVMVFIHGGAWRAGNAADNAEAADLFVNAGAHYVVLDFINVIEAGGSLFPMVEQVRRGVAWVYNNAKSFGGDPNRLYISGRSSGSHLGGVVLITDWAKDFGLPPDVVKGALLSSGMYDLEPVRLSKRGAYVKFTDAMEEQLSTQRHLERINCPVVLAHGTYETPEFQRQTREFAAALKAAGKDVKLIVGEGYNHFEIPETMANPYGLLGRAVLELMGLNK
ncbi:MAG TPA: alpha/beta hydrolase [Xanthobacteraceae bacterium]|nr:alpha/beta hydrolase [Xanthobacteraceae bacterium]